MALHRAYADEEEPYDLSIKEAWRDEYLKWLAGFANGEGGVLVLGRNDKGKAVGLPDAKKLLADLPNKIRDVLGIVAPVNLVTEKGKDLIEIRIEPYPSPISYKGEYHYRSGSTKQELKGAALERFLLKKRGRHWDGVPEPGFKPTECSSDALRLFRQNASRSGRMDRAVLKESRAAILQNLELSEGRYLKRAATLLFGKRPERYVSGAWIKIGFFVTDDNLRYQDEIHGSLFEQVARTLEILHTKYLKAYISYEGIQRREVFLYPYEALREALLNAVVHKDYSSGIPIQISVYDDHFVIWNPGELPGGWTLERLLGKHPSHPPNPLIANAFFRAGYIESWGRGIEKITRECHEHEIGPPIFNFTMSGLMLTFYANPAHLQPASQETTAARVGEKVGDRVGDKLTANQLQILELLIQNPRMSAHALAKTVALSKRKIEQNMAILKAMGRLKRVGSPKAGHWIPAHGQESSQETAGEKGRLETPVETPVEILAVLSKNPNSSLADVASVLGKSLRAVERASAKLVKDRKLRFVGPRKGGHWEVLK